MGIVLNILPPASLCRGFLQPLGKAGRTTH
jgi:hypothetical protein